MSVFLYMSAKSLYKVSPKAIYCSPYQYYPRSILVVALHSISPSAKSKWQQ